MFATAVGALGWLVVASVSAIAVEAGVGGGLVVGVSAYTTGGCIWASAVVMSKLLAESALVSWACREVFFSLALASKDGGAVFQHAFQVGPVFHCDNAR